MAFSNPQEDPTVATVQGVTKPAEPQAVSTGVMPGNDAYKVAQPGGMAPPAGTGPAPTPAGTSPQQDEGVASRVADITAQGSPLMRQARASGMAAGASRGLLNSSIAVGAGEDAAYRAATPIAQQEAAQAAARNTQTNDIASQMDRLRTQAGFENARQDKDISSRSDLADKQNNAAIDQLKLSQAGDVQKLQMQINSAEGQQKLALQADMDRLVKSNDLEIQRMTVSNGFNVAMAGIQQGNAESLTKLQSSLTSALQAQANTEQMQRMTAEFTNQQQLSAQSYQQTLGQIAATGDQAMREQAARISASLQELTLNLNQRNTEAAVNAAVNLFNAEAQIRASIMANPEMPASQRQQYMNAVSGLTGPTRDFINQALGAPATGGMMPPTTAPTAPGGMAPPSVTDIEAMRTDGIAGNYAAAQAAAQGLTPEELEAMKTDGIRGNYAAATR